MDNSTTTQSHTKKKSHLKPILIALASLLVVTGIGAATVLLLKQNLVKESEQNSQSKPVKSAQELVAELTKQNTIPALTNDNFSQHSPQGSLVFAKPEGKQFEVAIQTKHDVTYTAKNESAVDTAKILDEVKQFATTNTFQTITALQQSSNTTQYLAFNNSKATCEFTANPKDPAAQESTVSSYYTFACADSKAIDEQYALADKLLGLYISSNPALQPVRVDISTESKDDVGYHIMYSTSGNTKHVLLFGKVGNNTEYIADLAQGDAAYNNGKYNITPEVKAKISDPKYKGYLLRQVAGLQN